MEPRDVGTAARQSPFKKKKKKNNSCARAPLIDPPDLIDVPPFDQTFSSVRLLKKNLYFSSVTYFYLNVKK